MPRLAQRQHAIQIKPKQYGKSRNHPEKTETTRIKSPQKATYKDKHLQVSDAAPKLRQFSVGDDRLHGGHACYRHRRFLGPSQLAGESVLAGYVGESLLESSQLVVRYHLRQRRLARPGSRRIRDSCHSC